MSSVDIFGRQLSKKRKYILDGQRRRGPPGEGFKFTTDGHYDIDGKKLCHIADAEDMNDAVSKKVALSMIMKETETLFSFIMKLLEDSEKQNNRIINQLAIKLDALEKKSL